MSNEDVYLVIFRGNDYVHIHQIEGRETVIGRSQSCAVVLPDPSVSRAHAVIVRSGIEIIVRDLMSRNGTRLESELITEAKLCLGSKIEIGPFDLTCYSECSEALRATVVSDTSTWTANADRPCRPEVMKLTLKQRRVYERLLAGFADKEVARQLRISIHTVHDHVKQIYERLSVSSRCELLAQASSQRPPK